MANKSGYQKGHVPWNKGSEGVCKANEQSFKKGNVPWNKGTKGLTSANKTSFKKGNVPPNHREVGSERVTVDGYTEIKVEEPNKWKLKHRIVWEKHFSKLSRSEVIIFADGNKENFDIDNLLKVTRAELALLNKDDFKMIDRDLTIVRLNLVRLRIKNIKLKKGDKK